MRGQQLLEELGRRGLFWRHSGDMKRPHAILSTGKHATGFVNIREALTDPIFREGLAFELICELDNHMDYRDVTLVVGSGHASDLLIADVGRLLSIRYGRVVRSAFTDKVKQNGDEMEFKFDLKPDDVAVLFEDMETSGHTTAASMAALRARDPNVNILQGVGCVFTWNDQPEHLQGMDLIFLAESRMETFDVPKGEKCPLCEAGSEALKPKSKVPQDNWKRLTEG